MPFLALFLARFVIAWAANAFALLVANTLWSGVYLHGLSAYLLGGLILGLANAVLRPLLTLLTLPLVVLSFGFFYLLINIAMVAFAAWLTPRFSVTGFWDYVGVVFVVWLVNWAVNGLFRRERRRPAPL